MLGFLLVTTLAVPFVDAIDPVIFHPSLYQESSEAKVGDLLPNIHCPQGYEARVFAIGLEAPDGLAFDAKGNVCVVEESAGRVTRITGNGKHVVLASGLNSPEGICRDQEGNFLVVEDSADGRLLLISSKGKRNSKIKVLATGLDAPEGVFLHGETLYVSESSAQLVEQLIDARTRILSFHRKKKKWGDASTLVEVGLPVSFSELVVVGQHTLILSNEAAGGLVRNSLMRFNLSSNELKPFATGLIAPEGMCRSPNSASGFPLYIAEEGTKAAGRGRISLVDEHGQRSTFASGFGTLEDVLVSADGRVYVSEDSSGMIVELRPTP